jgi:DNA-binding MarR family transcriptional regulator
MSAQAAATPTAQRATPANLGFLLAKATQRWNELLHEGFAARGFPEVRPSYGSILIPLFEQDGQRVGELGRRARLAKQTMTTMIHLMERDGLVVRKADPDDRRAARLYLTARARRFQAAAEEVLHELDALVESRLNATRRKALKGALKEVMDL